MNKKFVPIHSTAQIITNSSTELFICNTSKTIEQMHEALGKIAEAIEQPHGVGEIKACHGPKELLRELWEIHDWVRGAKEDSWGDRNPILTVLYDFLPYTAKANADRDIVKTVPKFVEYKWDMRPEDQSWEDYQAEMEAEEAASWAQIEAWFEAHEKMLKKYIKGFIVLISADDNSIPGGLMDLIEDVFSAARFHLG